MTLRTARLLWGPEAVARALADATAEPVTEALARLVEDRARDLDDRAFAAWALALPWTRFCAVVRVITGDTARHLLEDEA